MKYTYFIDKYRVECNKCSSELYVVGFGGESDKLKCFNCSIYYDYNKSTRILRDDVDYPKLLKKWDTGSGEYPGIASSKIYCPWYLKMLLKSLRKI